MLIDIFEEKGINIEFGDKDEADFKNTVDFVTCSYYYTQITDAKRLKTNKPTTTNPYLKK